MLMVFKSVLKLMASVFIALLAGFVGSLFTFSAIPSWYAQLNKPFFTPPDWLFGPVWTILYILMGIAGFLVWEKKNRTPDLFPQVLKWYLIQLTLNSLWSILFFGLRIPFIAFVEIIILWISIVKTISLFKIVSPQAALLLYPYLGWVTFASVLNFGIMVLN